MSLVRTANSRLVKPTIRTKFHIDFDWWEREHSEFRVYLRSHLCAEHQSFFAESQDQTLVDMIDDETAEVRQMDGLQYALATHCTQEPEYLTQRTTLVDAIFRVFLANGNQPLTPEELAERISRPGQAQTILRTIGGPMVYKGLRPWLAG